jgi:ankyrin repeat protein
MKYKSINILLLITTLFILTDCNTKKESSKRVTVPASDEVISTQPEQNISIHEAALNGQLGLVTRLLEEGLNVNIKDLEGRTALMYASYNGHTEIMKKLIEKGALVNEPDSYGRTALMMASSGPYPAAVKLLLDHQADPNIADTDEHFTALMYAAAEGHLDVVRILLSYRADPALKDVDGDDAITFANNNGHREVATLLQSLK